MLFGRTRLDGPMPTCNCGCDQQTRGGLFAPGHDQARRTALERRVGGLLPLRDLIDTVEAFAAGRATSERLDQHIRQVFPKQANS